MHRLPAAAAARFGALGAVLVLASTMVACTSVDTSSAPPARTIRTTALDVSPFPPSNSAWYSFADLRARRPFARWQQERDLIEIVTWPSRCSRVPTGITFPSAATTITVATGPAPTRSGQPPCRAGQVLTSTFRASRVLHRNRATPVLLDGKRFTLPPAPALVLAAADTEPGLDGAVHPLRTIDEGLPQYSVPDSLWTLPEPVPASSRSIRLSWIGGTCEPNASLAYLRETASAVVIDIALPPPPIDPAPPSTGDPTVTCAGVGVTLTATVRLARPLGHRRLLQHRHGPRPAGQNAY